MNDDTAAGVQAGEPAARFGKSRTTARRCAGTGAAIGPADPALRFVLDPSGEIVLDLKGSLPGRGVWLVPARDALLTALRRGGFSRGFRKQARLADGVGPESFADRVGAQLQRSALQKLGLCRRAGVLAIGHDSVRDTARRGILYLTPTDASARETEKLANFLAKSARVPHFPVPADRALLGDALGAHATHVLLLRGGPSRSAHEALILWQRFSAESRA